MVEGFADFFQITGCNLGSIIYCSHLLLNSRFFGTEKSEPFCCFLCRIDFENLQDIINSLRNSIQFLLQPCI